jgi:Leucine-rich repeat (LRR) protein
MNLSYTLRKALFTIFIAPLLFTAQAQYVSVPDSNFGNWLNLNGYGSCMAGSSGTGWQLDTTCNRVLTDTIVNCSGSHIHDLTGISYFRRLAQLNCYTNQLGSLPPLPASLTSLHCDSNQLTGLSGLPASLGSLSCSNNQLSSLSALPASLTYLECFNNRLVSISNLPTSLTYVDCSGNQLTSLPALPAALNFLNCSNNHLSSLPSLPSFFPYLYCDHNQLTTLPALPAVLNVLSCSYNQLSSLPLLPASMYLLSCSNNQLSGLPALPHSLIALFCGSNRLSSLPVLPDSLYSLKCDSNPDLRCLPAIHRSQLYRFSIAGTRIQCMPNLFTALYYDLRPDSLPLCQSGTGCNTLNYVAQLVSGLPFVGVYPNPSQGSFTLQTLGLAGKGEYIIYDVAGREMISHRLANDNENITLDHAASGIYTLLIRSGEGDKVLKLVVE